MRSLSNRSAGRRSVAGSALWLVLSLLAAVLTLAVLLAGHPSSADAKTYSAFSDPEKTALSFVLSDERNARDFREEFGLTAGEMGRVLAAVREENEKLAGERAESERVVEANEELPKERVREKIAASDYDETLRAAIAETKAAVRAVLPEDRRGDLKPWVDGQWREATRESLAGEAATGRATATGLTCKVYATQYVGYTRFEVALPHRILKFNGGYKVRVDRGGYGATWAPVKEVGPWNTYDNYWQTGKYRTMWSSLPRCIPEARAAYYNNFNNGKDEYGRKVLNPAGVDLTPAVARELGMGEYESRWVHVYMPWARR